MATKANWPEMMERFDCDKIGSGWDVIIDNVACVGGATKRETESRARQICALPKMVAYLHTMAGHTDDCGYESPWASDAKDILREIGELE